LTKAISPVMQMQQTPSLSPWISSSKREWLWQMHIAFASSTQQRYDFEFCPRHSAKFSGTKKVLIEQQPSPASR